jgi:bacterioferritin-associated ferredoxin
MWVCICHALTDKDIEAAEADGAQTELEVYAHYGVKPQCGRCVPTVKCLMKCQNKAPICQAIADVQQLSSTPVSDSSEEKEEEIVELDKASNF